MKFYKYQEEFINLDQICSYEVYEAIEGFDGSSGSGAIIMPSPPMPKRLKVTLADGKEFTFKDEDLTNVAEKMGIEI